MPFRSYAAETINPTWKYHIDSADTQSTQPLIQKNFDGELQAGKFNFSFLKSSVWLKTTIPASNQFRFLHLSNPTISEIDFYLFEDNELIKEIKTGATLNIDTREYNFSKFFFEVPPSLKNQTIYIRLQTNGSLVGSFSMLGRNYLQKITNDQVISYLVNGILLSLTIIYLVIFITLRERTYLFYLIYIFLVSISIARTNGTLTFIPFLETSWLYKYQGGIEAATSVAAGVFGIHFLKLRKHKWLFRLFSLLVIFQAVWFIVAFVDNQFSMQMVEGTASVYIFLIIPVAGYVYYSQKYVPAIYFLFSWMFVFVGAMIYILGNAGSTIENSLLSQHALELGVAAEMVLLSVGVSKRIDGIIKQSIQVKADNIEILSTQKVKLKELVDEKTAELAARNKQLQSSIEELKETQQRLVKTEKMASLGTLSAGIAHEINNPLNFISASLRLLDEQLSSEDKADKLLGLMHDGVNRINGIVKSLGALTSLDQKHSTICDINDILKNCLEIINNDRKNEINWQVTLHPEDAFVQGDPAGMHLALMHLLSNAMDAIKEKGKISVTSTISESQIAIEIQDNGVGISPDNFSRIGDPFFTTKEPNEGVGLGLYVTNSIITEHGGKLDFESKQGKGSIFTVMVPLS